MPQFATILDLKTVRGKQVATIEFDDFVESFDVPVETLMPLVRTRAHHACLFVFLVV